MASSILLKRSSSALTKFFQPLRSVSATPSISRSFNTNALREASEDERDIDRRRSESGLPTFASILPELSKLRKVSAKDYYRLRSEEEAKVNAKLFREAERDNDRRRSESESALAKATPSVSATPSSDDERDIDQRRSESDLRRRDFPSNVYDPFSPTGSSSQVLHTVDQIMDVPFSGIGGGGLRIGRNAKEDNDALHLRVEMPGLGKEDVKVSVEENILTIKGEGEESRRRYSSRIDLPPKLYKLDGIKAEMKNGVLKVVVPKVKEDERKYTHQVQVE